MEGFGTGDEAALRGCSRRGVVRLMVVTGRGSRRGVVRLMVVAGRGSRRGVVRLMVVAGGGQVGRLPAVDRAVDHADQRAEQAKRKNDLERDEAQRA